MVDIWGTTSSVHYCVTARPNCSLSPSGTLRAFIIIVLISLSFSFGFMLIGAWPVLFFSGAELFALGYCFYYVLLHGGDFEKLTIDDDKVIVDIHEPGHDSHIELSGYWTRLVLDCMPDGYCRWLALRSSDREIKFGRFMTSEERLELAHQLQPRLGGYMT
jgi:uncharacterized membrane protein